jgi:hypothetical protein
MTNETTPSTRRGRPPGSTAEKTRLKRLELDRIKALKKRKKANKNAIKTSKTPVEATDQGEPKASPSQAKTELNQPGGVPITHADAAPSTTVDAPGAAAAQNLPDLADVAPDLVAIGHTPPATAAVADGATDASYSNAPIRPSSAPVYPFGHGGARPNAGRRGREYEGSDVALDFDEARARNETAKAGLNEIELRIKSGEYIARAAVQTASATALATMAQTMRSIPDNMERKGIAPDVCVLVERVIDEVMAGLSQELQMLSSEHFNAE